MKNGAIAAALFGSLVTAAYVSVPRQQEPAAPSKLADPIPPSFGWIVPNRYGVVGDGRTDCSQALQNIIDRITGPATLAFEQGRYRFSWPVFISKPYIKIQGCGQGITEFCSADGTSSPPIIFGLRSTDSGGGARPAHRPDAFGILDQSIAKQPNAWKGFASDGDGYLGVVGCGAQLGCWRSPPGSNDMRPSWSHWEDPEGFTIDFAAVLPSGLDGIAGSTIIGLGDAVNPGPWNISCDTNSQLAVRFCVPSGTEDLRCSFPDRGLVRIRATFDHPNGVLTVVANGNEVGRLKYQNRARFARSKGNLPFWVGPSPSGEIFDQSVRALPKMSVLAWKVSLGIATQSSDDKSRYAVDPFKSHDGKTVCALLGDVSCPQSRCTQVYCWPGPDGWARSYAILGLSSGTWGGIYGQSIRDVTFTHGPLAFAQVLHFSAKDVESHGGATGFASIPFGAAYMVDAYRCRFSGNDAGVSISWALARFSSVDVPQGGSVFALLSASGVDWWGGFLGNPGPRPRCAIDIVGGEYGGISSLSRIIVDNESDPFSESAISCSSGLQSGLVVDGVTVSQIAPGAHGVLLTGDRRGADVPEARVYGVRAWSGDPSVNCVGGAWTIQQAMGSSR